jgi:hypothetical protein
MTISFQIGARDRRLAECQTPHYSTLRKKIVGAQSAEQSS